MRRHLWVAAALAAVIGAACTGTDTKRDDPPLTVGPGACCGDPNTCARNICATSLHCGDAQSPTSVYACCANGSFCCLADSDCQDHFPGGACDTATSTCFEGCATDDDTRCAAAFHCEGVTCVADAATGTGTCDEASDCASGNCSAPFDPNAAASVCAPAGECANGNQAWPVGYTLCTGSAFFRRCDAVGRWSAPTSNPHPAGEACDAGGGANSGFRAAATCTSGLDAVDPGFASTCASCFPHRATAGGCLAACGGSDLNCWTGHHCAAHAADTCVSDANGSACDVDGECSSGRCTAAFVCADKLADGETCAANKNSDCTSGWCNGTTCATKKANNVQCAADVECQSGHCSNSFDPTVTTGFCSPAGTCARNGSAYLPGWVECSADATTSTFARRCYPTGEWLTLNTFTPQACEYSGLGAHSGYASPSCASGNGAAGITTVCDHGCGGMAPTPTFDDCRTSCSGIDDSTCAGAYYCDASACQADLPDGTVCTRDGMCATNRCEPSGCQAKVSYGGDCDEDSDCETNFCDAGTCENWYQ